MSDKFKDLAKKGWHPEKSGTTLRGQVSGLVHRNKKDEPSNHVARPISELKDTSSFAPPPKRTGTGLAAPPPRSTETRKVVAAPSKYQDPRGDTVAPPVKVSQSQELADYQTQHQPQQEEEAPAPRGPYRSNTSGLSTDHLPKPPGRRDGADGRAPPPPSYESATRQVPPKPAAPGASKPSLPPRLPPRTNSASPTSSNSSKNTSTSNLINQGAANRLGAAGVSVPGLGIHNNQPQPAAASPTSPPPPPRQGASHQVNELQNRFSRFRAGSSPPSQSQAQQQEAPAEGTTWEQKQAAIKTASSFQKDPSSVSMTDAKAAASTANNFRQRHGEQVAAGVKSANSLNQKYGVSNKIGGFMASGQQQQQQQQQPEGQQSGVTGGPGNGTAPSLAALAGKKKPPPPPPPKKPGLGASAPAPAAAQNAAADEPPPIPLATRPTF